MVGCGLGIGGGRRPDEEDVALSVLSVLLVSAGPEDDPEHEEQQGDRVPESPHLCSLRMVSACHLMFGALLEDKSRGTGGLTRPIRYLALLLEEDLMFHTNERQTLSMLVPILGHGTEHNNVQGSFQL